MASGCIDPDEKRMAATPCVKVCVIEEATMLCIGCRRSLAEIAAWSTMTDADRRRVMASLQGRRLAGSGKVDAE
jgi:hypothetical protein